MSSSNLDLNRQTFQSSIRSKLIDDNFQDIQNNFNALRTEYNTTVSSTAAEVVNARDTFTSLQDNIHARNIFQGFHNTGGVVTTLSSNILSITAGSAIVNGVGTEWTAASSATIGAATTGRKDIIQIATTGVLSIAQGTDGATAPLPTLANTFRPLYMVTVDTASPQVFTSGRITDIRRQGCYANGKYFFKIQDAVNFVTAGEIKVMQGSYYEEVDLSGKSNIILKGDRGVNLYRPGGSSYAMKSINTVGNEEINLSIKNINFKGNSKAGAFESLRIKYTDKFSLIGCTFDGNGSSTASKKDFLFSNCDNFSLYENQFVNWYASTSAFNTCTRYFEDGFMKAQFVFCASTSEFINMKAKGFTLLTGMGTRMPRANQTTAAGTGGADAHIHSFTTDTALGGDGVNLGSPSALGGLNHTHGGSVNSTSNIPAYYDLIPLTHR